MDKTDTNPGVFGEQDEKGDDTRTDETGGASSKGSAKKSGDSRKHGLENSEEVVSDLIMSSQETPGAVRGVRLRTPSHHVSGGEWSVR